TCEHVGGIGGTPDSRNAPPAPGRTCQGGPADWTGARAGAATALARRGPQQAWPGRRRRGRRRQARPREGRWRGRPRARGPHIAWALLREPASSATQEADPDRDRFDERARPRFAAGADPDRGPTVHARGGWHPLPP